MDKDKWEPCPRCGSNKVKSRGGCFFAFLGFIIIGTSLWFLLIPYLGILMTIIGVVIGAFFLLTAPFAKDGLQCEDCNYSWKYPADNNEYLKK